MPQLKSGRHFALELAGFAETIRIGGNPEVQGVILAYRLTVRTPADLAHLLPVVFFKEDAGTPPDAPKFRSGYLVRDVLAGKAGWTTTELAELRQWLATNSDLQAWLTANFREIDAAIKSSPLWDRYPTDD